MQEIIVSETGCVAGGSLASWAAGQLATAALKFIYDAVASGQVDYAGLAESQGTYYNMVGA